MCKAYCKAFYDRDGYDFFKYQMRERGITRAIIHAILSGVEETVVSIWSQNIINEIIEMAKEEVEKD